MLQFYGHLINSFLITKLNRDHNRYLHFAARQLRNPYDWMSHNYTELWQLLRVPKISNRFTYADMLLLFKVVKRFIECTDILSKINFSVPSKSLSNAALFKQSYQRTNYGGNSVYKRLFKKANFLGPSLNYFGTSLQDWIESCCSNCNNAAFYGYY